MLDAKSLAVLQSLKSDLKAAKPIHKGTIKGTGRSFGFVTGADGSEFFLPPNQMEKVFPGDEVTFSVVELADGKQQAELESLFHSHFTTFNGIYQSKGKAQGVKPFNDSFSGWLFVAPKNINGSNNNDLVIAKVTRHPWETGKAQAEIVQSLGSSENNRSWYSMALQEHRIAERFSDEELAEAERLAELNIDEIANCEDLTHLEFVSIDGKTTLDVDDAVSATANENGWDLHVAIADVSAFIKPDTLLFQTSRQRMTTTYLPGLTIPMLPESLSHNALSLLENQRRLALVFTLTIETTGAVVDFSVKQAVIKNHGKLNYDDVSNWIEGNDYPEHQVKRIEPLLAATDALAGWRRANANTMQNRVDYRIKVDSEFNVIDIITEPKNKARDIIEEAMVATNACIAEWLKTDNALFMTHQGFKPDRETELKGLLRDYAPDVAELDGHKLEDFRAILKSAETSQGFPLLSVLQKRFERSKWSSTAAPHFGLGFEQYTNGTSPIRKFTDLCIHTAIKQKLNSETVAIDNQFIDEINDRSFASRQVSQTIENRLRLKWLSQQPKQDWDAKIVHINASGLIVQLVDNGATGLLSLRKKKEPYSYDALRMQMKAEDIVHQLGDSLKVQLVQCDESGLVVDFAADSEA